MYGGKVFLCLVFIAFASLQLADCLQCHQCHDVVSCRNPTTVVCDPVHANATHNVSSAYYPDVKLLNSNNYSCFIGAYNFTNVTVVEVRGCIMTGAINCMSQLLNATLTTDSCNVCQNSLCNIRNATTAPTDLNNNSTQTNNTNNNNTTTNIPPKSPDAGAHGSAVACTSSIIIMVGLLFLAKVSVI